MAVTIKDIAEKVGVSRGTVDRALNNRGRIDPQVEQQIKEAAAQLGYVHKARKRKNASARKRKIGIVTQLSGSSFMIAIRQGILQAKKELEELPIEIIVKERNSVDEKEQLEAIDELLAEGIDALAIMPIDSERVRDRLNWMTMEKNIPVVTFNSDIVGTKRVCFVGMDNKQSGKTAASLFKIMMRGTGKVLIITGHFSSPLNNARVEGFIEEIKEIAPDIEIAGVQGSFNHTADVEQIIERAMMGIVGIDGIFVVSGGQGGIAKAFQKLGIEKRPYVVIYDQTPKNEKILLGDTVDFLIDQNGFEQGYRPPRLLANLLLNEEMPEQEYYYTGIDIKTKYNL